MAFYSFDADSFISSWRVYYRNAGFPGIWSGFDRLIRDGRLQCAQPVYEEIARGGDELYEWVKARKDLLVYGFDVPIQEAVKVVQARFPNLVNPDGGSDADPWVIALAMVKQGYVVTQEGRTGATARYRKIPDVCAGLSIPCMNIFEVISREKWVLGLMDE